MTTKKKSGPVRDRRIPPLLSVTQVADLLGMSRHGVQYMINRGELPAVQVGSTWVIREAVVTALTTGADLDAPAAEAPAA